MTTLVAGTSRGLGGGTVTPPWRQAKFQPQPAGRVGPQASRAGTLGYGPAGPSPAPASLQQALVILSFPPGNWKPRHDTSVRSARYLSGQASRSLICGVSRFLFFLHPASLIYPGVLVHPIAFSLYFLFWYASLLCDFIVLVGEEGCPIYLGTYLPTTYRAQLFLIEPPRTDLIAVIVTRQRRQPQAPNRSISKHTSRPLNTRQHGLPRSQMSSPNQGRERREQGVPQKGRRHRGLLHPLRKDLLQCTPSDGGAQMRETR